MAILSGVALTAYIGFIAYGLCAPAKQHHPEDGMAIGCLMIAMIAAIALAALLLIGVVASVPLLIKIAFYVTVVPLGYVVIGVIVAPILHYRRKRRESQWSVADSDDSPSN